MDEMRQKIIEHFAALTDEQLEAEMKAANYDFYKTVTTNVLDPCADLRAKLKQAEEEALEFDQKIENAYQAWKDVYDQLAAKEAELADLRQWKESAMEVFAKIDLQEVGKEIGVRLGHDISPAILPWIINVKAELAERNRELDEAIENLKALGQQQMDDHKAHKAELDLYRKAVGPVKEADDELLFVMITDKELPKAEQKRIAGMCVKAVRDRIRILGEADLLK